MGIVTHGRDAVDGYFGWQQGVKTVNQSLDVVYGLLGVEVGNHQSRVDAGIGAASASDGRWDAQ